MFGLSWTALDTAQKLDEAREDLAELKDRRAPHHLKSEGFTLPLAARSANKYEKGNWQGAPAADLSGKSQSPVNLPQWAQSECHSDIPKPQLPNLPKWGSFSSWLTITALFARTRARSGKDLLSHV